MTDNELLLALSDMIDKKLDAKLKPIENDIKDMKGDIHKINLYQENIISPRLETIESCYTDTYRRYKNYADKMETVFEDVELLKKVVREHSAKLEQVS
ncbi:hypothetical protein GCM10008910_04160 [Faecalicatena orotica]|uniref:Biogenesis of lysosome-related organelles complex 1 subunit BLI1 n=1 Tax=Faecalicatena orotica TaxID=1544 RepID=A0A2Y9BBV6_9FIRM|nr:hypothetical protein [Faecalicatena orotica]PWJ30914.1 hypothetical protein A8806_103322 [Faecalicatena orotica]SSA55076.1 hypothetical protein SAMN05216536_103322 [Faecalicatena orotica]